MKKFLLIMFTLLSSVTTWAEEITITPNVSLNATNNSYAITGSEFWGTISAVVINYTTNNNKAITLSCKVGNNSVGQQQTQYNKNGGFTGDVSFSNISSTGNISINATFGGGKSPNVTINSITVTYEAPTVTLNSAGYGTFSYPYGVEISGADAYTATISGETINCTKIESNQIPVCNGVLLYGDPGATVTLKIVESPAALSSNDLKPTINENDELISVPADAYTLGGSVFKHFTGAPFNKHKAYFTISNSEAKPLSIEFNDEVTAINNVESKATKSVRKALVNGQLVIMTPNGNFTTTGAQMK